MHKNHCDCFYINFCSIYFQEDQNEKRDSTEGHVTLTTSAIGGGTDEEGSGGADVANPLQKYMMMLMQDKPKEQVQEDTSSSQKKYHLPLFQEGFS